MKPDPNGPRDNRENPLTHQVLFHHLTIDLLEDAFHELKEDAAAGVDDRDVKPASQWPRCQSATRRKRTGPQ
jgi:hypothetical protein